MQLIKSPLPDNTKTTRKCGLCGAEKEKNEQNYYRNGKTWATVCIDCSADDQYMKRCRNLAKEKGVASLEAVVALRKHQLELAIRVIESLKPKPETKPKTKVDVHTFLEDVSNTLLHVIDDLEAAPTLLEANLDKLNGLLTKVEDALETLENQ